jgi:hypothetical protein
LATEERSPINYRDQLPQLGGDLFLTDGGTETVLIFHEGLDLPAVRGLQPGGPPIVMSGCIEPSSNGSSRHAADHAA